MFSLFASPSEGSQSPRTAHYVTELMLHVPNRHNLERQVSHCLGPGPGCNVDLLPVGTALPFGVTRMS